MVDARRMQPGYGPPTKRPNDILACVSSATDLRSRVDEALRVFLRDATGSLARIGEDLQPLADAIGTFVLDRGKRLRPAFCYWGYRAVGGPDGDEIINVAAA